MRFGKSMLVVMMMVALSAYAQEPPADFNDRSERPGAGGIVGSWVLDVRLAISPPFQAFHTFHAGGTMSESTNLLATLTEGPGHGTWERVGETYNSTFELFIFNEDHTPAGLIRVRETLKLVDANTLSGFTVADLILPDGTIIENIDSGPATGRRVRVMPVRPEEMSSFPKNAAWARRSR